MLPFNSSFPFLLFSRRPRFKAKEFSHSHRPPPPRKERRKSPKLDFPKKKRGRRISFPSSPRTFTSARVHSNSKYFPPLLRLPRPIPLSSSLFFCREEFLSFPNRQRRKRKRGEEENSKREGERGGRLTLSIRRADGRLFSPDYIFGKAPDFHLLLCTKLCSSSLSEEAN